MTYVFPEDPGQDAIWRGQRESEREFRLARRKTVVDRLGRRLRRWLSGVDLCCEGCCDFLLCFDEERAGRESGEQGRGDTGGHGRKRVFETVDVSKIVGSVGRCRSFDARFLPVCSCSMERWKRVARAVREGKSLPPVELYRLGEEYFVLDGNHRVSVARHRGMPAIEALVTEISMPRGS
jgi:hypothetical protein